MKREKIIILPRLHDYNGDLTKQWFVYYSYKNHKTNRMQRFRIYKGFAECKSAKERYAVGERIINEYSSKLRGGWDPWTGDQEVIYRDQLDYSYLSSIYGEKRKGVTTIRVQLSKYIEKIKPSISEATFLTYVSKLRIFVIWIEHRKLGDVDLSEISNETILDFFDYLIRTRKSSKSTVNKYKQILFVFFEDLLKKKKIWENPVYDIPKVAQTADWGPQPIPNAIVEKVRTALIEDPQLWLAIQFQFYCFIRPNEIRQMKIKHLNLVQGTISLPGSITKNRKQQTVSIPKQFLTLLLTEYQLDQYEPEDYVIGKNGTPGKNMLGKNNLRFRFNRYRKALNIPLDYKFYSWKHTGAVAASNAGIPVKDIQMQMRHHSLDVTDRYLRKMKGTESDALKNGFPTL